MFEQVFETGHYRTSVRIAMTRRKKLDKLSPGVFCFSCCNRNTERKKDKLEIEMFAVGSVELTEQEIKALVIALENLPTNRVTTLDEYGQRVTDEWLERLLEKIENIPANTWRG